MDDYAPLRVRGACGQEPAAGGMEVTRRLVLLYSRRAEVRAEHHQESFGVSQMSFGPLIRLFIILIF